MGGRSATFEGMLETEESVRQKNDHRCIEFRRDDEIWAPNLVWREKVVQWCYDVADHLNEDRSVVYVAMNILDRFCATTVSTRQMDEKMYEIASLSSIFLAVRIAGSGDLLLQELISMSRGGISIQDIITTGTSIISALSWEERILTPIDFVHSIFQLLPSLNDSPRKQVMLDSASYLIELAVCDVFFSHCKASSLAVAAMLNALQANLCSELSNFNEVVLKATSVAATADDPTLLCARLQGIYNQSVDNVRQCGPHLIEEDEPEENVPPSRGFLRSALKRDIEVVSNEECMPQKRIMINHHHA